MPGKRACAWVPPPLHFYRRLPRESERSQEGGKGQKLSGNSYSKILKCTNCKNIALYWRHLAWGRKTKPSLLDAPFSVFSCLSAKSADQTESDWQNPPLLLYPVVFVEIWGVPSEINSSSKCRQGGGRLENMIRYVEKEAEILDISRTVFQGDINSKCGTILVKSRSLTDLQVPWNRRSKKSPRKILEEEHVELQCLSRQSRERQSRRRSQVNSSYLILGRGTPLPLSRIFAKNIANAQIPRILASSAVSAGWKRETVATVQIQDTRAGLGGIMGIMEADTFWSAVAISPKSFGVFYGRTIKRTDTSRLKFSLGRGSERRTMIVNPIGRDEYELDFRILRNRFDPKSNRVCKLFPESDIGLPIHV
ncbi:hypothetical protein EAG_09106 [Camponotus floridanus]|uniref:Uncharacterized protein n=1 Tax=Camponotus floridanus TaxID=104421 RepID=E2AHB5_CAMFO|nr:hypothetical protein EAG_09106 [Camponotus floridanus]